MDSEQLIPAIWLLAWPLSDSWAWLQGMMPLLPLILPPAMLPTASQVTPLAAGKSVVYCWGMLAAESGSRCPSHEPLLSGDAVPAAQLHSAEACRIAAT